MVNVRERIPVERRIFSAAHELGHLILHLNAYDVSKEVENEKEETDANLFAAHFLMPPALVTYLCRSLGLKKHHFNSEDIYRLALLMRTSYEATCSHLRNIEFIYPQQHDSLKKVPPRKIKQKWTRGIGHNDIWPLDEKQNG